MRAQREISICPEGGNHKLGFFKNCEVFPKGHPEFLDCEGCRTLRCVKCYQVVSMSSMREGAERVRSRMLSID